MNSSAQILSFPPKNTKQRKIGAVRGREKGPTLICVGGIHGNEPTGVEALERLRFCLFFPPPQPALERKAVFFGGKQENRHHQRRSGENVVFDGKERFFKQVAVSD